MPLQCFTPLWFALSFWCLEKFYFVLCLFQYGFLQLHLQKAFQTPSNNTIVIWLTRTHTHKLEWENPLHIEFFQLSHKLKQWLFDLAGEMSSAIQLVWLQYFSEQSRWVPRWMPSKFKFWFWNHITHTLWSLCMIMQNLCTNNPIQDLWYASELNLHPQATETHTCPVPLLVPPTIQFRQETSETHLKCWIHHAPLHNLQQC